ncbi:MAG: endonuclease/exonuclease/phosphatase family protein [Clostridiales bacterium]|nr:endonuclease/exonuclease/phosphatase family protein [Clostridiales bacterium]
MKTMSFNVLCGGPIGKRWRSRRPLIARQIRDIDPDTFGLQEAHSGWMDYVCRHFPDYDYSGVGRDDGKRGGEFSPVFFKKDKFELLDSGNFWLSETPEKPSKSWKAACIRICSWALLKDRSSGKQFVQMNTHLDHVSEEARVKGIGLVVDKIKSFDVPVICTGDFNTDEGSESYKIMTADVMGDVKYLAEDTDSGCTYTGFDPEKMKDNSPIDFIFVKKSDIAVKTYKISRELINGKLPSDHFAISAEIELK